MNVGTPKKANGYPATVSPFFLNPLSLVGGTNSFSLSFCCNLRGVPDFKDKRRFQDTSKLIICEGRYR
jgi:hypothetical protein